MFKKFKKTVNFNLIAIKWTNKFFGMHQTKKCKFRMQLKIITRETSMKGKKSVTGIKWNAHM